MANHDDGIRSMDNIRFGDSSIANQGHIGVFYQDNPRFHADHASSQTVYHANNQTNTHHYYGVPSPANSPVRTCVRVGLPPRNANLVERKGLLHELEKMLPREGNLGPVALWGMAGSGKTQLALHYAYQRFHLQKCSVFWIHAKDEASFIESFKIIAQKAKIEVSSDDRVMLQAVQEWMESQPTYVLVIDSADDLELFTRNSSGSVQICEFIPDGPNGTVIWTSQDRTILGAVGWTRGLKVCSMTPDEAVSLLEITANHGEKFKVPDEALQLVLELECNPLVVSHVASSMRAHSTPEEMLSRLADPHQRCSILEAPSSNLNRSQKDCRSIFNMLSDPVRRLAHHNAVAYRIIGMIAYLDCRAIPLDMFLGVNGHQDDNLARGTLTRLQDLSFLFDDSADGEGQKYKADGLVQEAIRHHFDQEEIQNNRSEADEPRRYSIYLAGQVCLRAEAIAALSRIFPRHIYYNTLELCSSLLQHMTKVLQRGNFEPEERVETADLFIRVGDYMLFCGRWREMKAPYENALGIRHKLLGKWDTQTVAAMEGLANAEMTLGNFQTALKLSLEARAIREERLAMSEAHPDIMANETNIGAIYRILGDFEMADLLLTRVLARRIEAIGEDHPDSAESMYEMAQLYGNQGARDKQMELLKKCFTVQSRHLGDLNPKTLLTKMQLGSLLARVGDGAGGRKLHEEVLGSLQTVLGKMHPYTLETRRLIARYSDDDKEMAFQATSEVATDFEATLGRSHPLTLRALNDLASMLYSRQDYDATAGIQKETLDVYSQQLGEVHPATLRLRLDLADTFLSQGRTTESKALATAAFETLSTKYGESASILIHKAVGLMHPNEEVGSTVMRIGGTVGALFDLFLKKPADSTEPKRDLKAKET